MGTLGVAVAGPGADGHFRVLVDLSRLPALHATLPRLCVTVRGEAGTAPPASARARRLTRPPPFASACASDAASSALQRWQRQYAALLAGRRVTFAEAFASLSHSDLLTVYLRQDTLLPLHFRASGLSPGQYTVTALTLSPEGRKVLATAPLVVPRGSAAVGAGGVGARAELHAVDDTGAWQLQ